MREGARGDVVVDASAPPDVTVAATASGRRAAAAFTAQVAQRVAAGRAASGAPAARRQAAAASPCSAERAAAVQAAGLLAGRPRVKAPSSATAKPCDFGAVVRKWLQRQQQGAGGSAGQPPQPLARAAAGAACPPQPRVTLLQWPMPLADFQRHLEASALAGQATTSLGVGVSAEHMGKLWAEAWRAAPPEVSMNPATAAAVSAVLDGSVRAVNDALFAAVLAFRMDMAAVAEVLGRAVAEAKRQLAATQAELDATTAEAAATHAAAAEALRAAFEDRVLAPLQQALDLGAALPPAAAGLRDALAEAAQCPADGTVLGHLLAGATEVRRVRDYLQGVVAAAAVGTADVSPQQLAEALANVQAVAESLRQAPGAVQRAQLVEAVAVERLLLDAVGVAAASEALAVIESAAAAAEEVSGQLDAAVAAATATCFQMRVMAVAAAEAHDVVTYQAEADAAEQAAAARRRLLDRVAPAWDAFVDAVAAFQAFSADRAMSAGSQVFESARATAMVYAVVIQNSAVAAVADATRDSALVVRRLAAEANLTSGAQ